MHEIIAYNKVTRIWIYFIVVFGFGFNYLDLDRIRIFLKVNPLLSVNHGKRIAMMVQAFESVLDVNKPIDMGQYIAQLLFI